MPGPLLLALLRAAGGLLISAASIFAAYHSTKNKRN